MYVCYADTVVPYIDIAFSVGFTNYFSNAFLLKIRTAFYSAPQATFASAVWWQAENSERWRSAKLNDRLSRFHSRQLWRGREFLLVLLCICYSIDVLASSVWPSTFCVIYRKFIRQSVRVITHSLSLWPWSNLLTSNLTCVALTSFLSILGFLERFLLEFCTGMVQTDRQPDRQTDSWLGLRSVM